MIHRVCDIGTSKKTKNYCRSVSKGCYKIPIFHSSLFNRVLAFQAVLWIEKLLKVGNPNNHSAAIHKGGKNDQKSNSFVRF
jgi:hypothetical protein